MEETCPLCGTTLPPGASICPSCGAKLDRPAARPVDQLLQGLDDLTKTADAALSEELARREQVAVRQAQAVERALGELEAVEAELSAADARRVEEQADLTDFVKRVEASVAAKARSGPAAPPPRNRLSGPLATVGGLIAAGGLFLVPAELYVGLITLFAGLALLGMGGVLYGTRPARQ
jgi:uncharacterized Zn finger protein (UPF0148 family)